MPQLGSEIWDGSIQSDNYLLPTILVMWSAVNKLALPSPEEKRCVREAIDELEADLNVAVEVLERARAHVDALTKELEERKAWIAPIRLLPVEILSEIFILVSDLDRFGPILISEVNRLWRYVVLSTSRAWSRIYLNEGDTPYAAEYIEMFLPRSNPILLHLYIPDDDSMDTCAQGNGSREPAIYTLCAAIQRFQCLALVDRGLELLKDGCYPNLTRVTIMDPPLAIPPSFFDRSRFPHLRFLDCKDSWWEHPEGHVGTICQLPPLQYLSISFEEHLTWIEAVQSCTMTLEVLELCGYFLYEGTQVFTIAFPTLECLHLNIWDDGMHSASWPIRATTPALVSYEKRGQFQLAARLPFHDDVRKVTHLRTVSVPNLSQYSALRLLQVRLKWSEISILINQLTQDLGLCSELEAIEIILHPRGSTAEGALYEVMEKFRPHVDLYITESWSFSIINCFDSKRCGTGMPCRPE